MNAEKIHDRANAGLDAYLPQFGEGTKSPCSPASARLFTPDCAAAVAAMQSLVAELDAGSSGRQFGTLRAVLTKVTEAAGTYQRLECQTNPKTPSVRKQCLTSGATIAQSPTDIRHGAVLALTGK
ncbi:hypothetical protein [Streptomyces melanogenes]|uniref:hypothetical protein n=1 Tax=Streptomyces melanogenes TaxID=67326 RepID=UPI00378F6244